MYYLSLIYQCKEQYIKLDDVFSKWKGSLEQVDDVCVIGIQIQLLI
jgi:hypothetical protein